MAITIRELERGDVERYATLVQAHSRVHDRETALRRAELVQWLAFQNPVTDGNPHYFVATDGSRLLGHLGRMPTEFFVEGRRHLASFAHDLFVHPELQASGRGFFVSMKLYNLIDKSCPSFCGMVWTNEINIKLQQTRKYHQSWATRFVHYLRLDEKLDRIPGALSPFNRIIKPVTRSVISTLDWALSIRGGREVVQVERFDERFDDLAERIGPRMGIAPVKDAKYLNWKYADRPSLDPVMFMATGAPGQPVGFVVLTTRLGPGDVGTILELCAAPDDKRTMIALVAKSLDYYRSVGASNVECVATDPRFIEMYKEMAFIARPPRQPLFISNTHKYVRPAVIRDLSRWHLSYGDSEGPH